MKYIPGIYRVTIKSATKSTNKQKLNPIAEKHNKRSESEERRSSKTNELSS